MLMDFSIYIKAVAAELLIRKICLCVLGVQSSQLYPSFFSEHMTYENVHQMGVWQKTCEHSSQIKTKKLSSESFACLVLSGAELAGNKKASKTQEIKKNLSIHCGRDMRETKHRFRSYVTFLSTIYAKKHPSFRRSGRFISNPFLSEKNYCF